MVPAPMKPRRWFRFSLRTLFWLMLVVAMLMLAVNERRKRIQLEAEIKRQAIEIRYLTASRKVLEREVERRLLLEKAGYTWMGIRVEPEKTSH